MKISVISDLHLGFKRGTEREEDPFIAARGAFEKSKEMGVDLVILAGDVFDSRFPRPEHWSRFMKILSTLKDGKGIDVIKTRNKEKVNEDALEGIPVVAIHGTHERRGSGLTNPIEALEEAGFLIHLHCSSILLGLDGEKIGIHGMSGVPEKYSKEVLKKWDPETFSEAYNIFMIHQDMDPYIFNPATPPSLSLEDLPPGFECYVSGHIHWREKTELRGSPFIIPGSLIPTQLKKKESEIEKGFFVVDTQKKEIDFEEVDPPRMFFYEEIENEEGSIREIENLVGDRLEEIFSDSFESKPLVRLKIKGKMPGGVSTNDLDLSQVKNKYSDRGIISISKDLEEEGVDKKIQMLRDVRNEELSVEEIGMKTLREEMEETGSRMDPDMIFDDLVQGNIENVMNRLLEGDETGYDPEEEGSVEETAEEESGSEEEERHGEKEWWRKASNKT